MENHRWSKVKRHRKGGFRKRMRSSGGRKIINRRRSLGRSVNIT